MAGRILREDVEAVRERLRIEEVVGAHVALRPAGVGSLKGLCPFHDERSPSFHVRPQVGRYHCFGCGEGGDVIAFVQKVDGLGFTDAVEYLASRAGMQLRYEEGGGPSRPGEEPGRRRRLLDAHRISEEFFREQLVSPEAAVARAFLAERGFDRSAADDFGVGFAPQGWDSLLRHLRGRGFTEAELTASGLVSQGARGIYDRFRGRLVWPIREVTGETVGFGARRLLDDDNGPKYLNTPETPLYRKSHVLYGIDLAKREISREKQVVVVEGYTDVMAMHLSGVRTAVATCGTAFGPEHARIVRRLVGDSGGAGGVQLAGGSSVGGAIVFTFDGDAAGQKAALRAFGEDQAFNAQTFVAVEPSGMDPCELRQERGPDAVRALVASRQPLFEFVIRSTLAAHDLTTAEGRVGALRATAPVVAGIRDSALRPEYERLLAGWLGMDDVGGVRRTVADAARRGSRPTSRPGDRDGARRPAPADDATTPAPMPRMSAPDRRDPVAQVERTALEVVLQHPTLVPPEFDALAPDACTAPAYRAVHEAVRAAGGLTTAGELVAQGGESAWVGAVIEAAAEPVQALLTELAVAPLPEDRPDALPAYVRGVVMRLVDVGLTRRVADVRGRLQRLGADADPVEQRSLLGELLELEAQRRTLRPA
ncbi:DNA primase [Cellulomonas dongxiuzhuiae]|uniref:DNA primase n=1 Tax=Cellulomonas dongxiuzhuiae TaxID=2819979 RepID=A0ABX8GGW2_9CELL|nr:DNA primase [Cellulomonas dongxiuzhuiae]MBO3086873.1 DNA primase [Cellulomonas dongxiuzhuiae]MBO3093775.1 DNA primase [Cellulomonas dongxiuzhuiae]QWC14881.1 DNA primase [Cellulomonas dongxiuzhuiae]